MNNHDHLEYVEFREVEVMIALAIDAAITRHNRNASMISMVLGIVFLALFVDGFLRVIGVVPPFLGIDVNIMSALEDTVTQNVMDKIHGLSTQI